MKKFLSLLLVVVMMAASFAMIASAESFVPSIGYKPAPELDYKLDDEGRKVIGHVVDKDGNQLTVEYHDCIVITPVSEAKTSERIPADAADLLLEVYDEISAEGMKLSSLSDQLNALVAADFGEGKDADLLVVRDLFDVTVLCDELKEKLAPVGNTITLTFKVDVDEKLPVYVMSYKNGAWAPIVKTVNNGDGTISCTFEDFCPVAFFVPTEAPDNDKTPTGDNANTLWVIVMISAMALIAVLLVANRKSFKKSELN